MDNNSFDLFTRVDEKHPLDLYIGVDGLSRHTLFLISSTQPQHMTSSLVINAVVGRRKDSRWGISFILLDNKFIDIFNCFCNDIVESSRLIEDKKTGADFIVSRYNKWQTMLSKSRGELLSQSTVKGLVGELLFLKNYLIPKYGQKIALNAWIGPNKADQDFICNNTWYEVKATESGYDNIKITSVEQLDTPNNGELVVAYLDKTSSVDESKITLNTIYEEVYNLLENDELKNKLSEILLGFGYFPRPEYDDPAFKLTGISRYLVDKTFPSLRRQDIPEAVINSEYQLSLSSIGNHLIKN